MAIITQKPNMLYSWGATGSINIPTIDKILEGWVEEIPPHEMANWIENRQDLALKYLFQEGFANWDSQFEFNANSLTKYNGVVYIAKLYNINKEPTTNPDIWEVAFDKYGAAKAVKDVVDKILNDEGFLSLYVSKAFPVMTGNAQAPSFRASSGLATEANGNNEEGFAFTGNDNSGLFRDSTSGDLVLQVDGVKVGKVNKNAVPITSDDETLVTTSFLKDYVDMITKGFQIQVGMSIITTNSANPATYYGYGTWVLDLQGRALVGVSSDVSSSTPDWVKVVDNNFGEFNATLETANLPSFKARILLNTWVHGDDASGAGAILTANRNWEGGTQYPDKSWAEFVGESKPFSIVQPSQTKYIWTRTA